MNQLKTMKIGSREYPVEGYIETKQTGFVPLVNIPVMSDYKWQLSSLRSRMENPEMYREGTGEDVEAVIAMLCKWLEIHSSEATPTEREETARLLKAATA